MTGKSFTIVSFSEENTIRVLFVDLCDECLVWWDAKLGRVYGEGILDYGKLEHVMTRDLEIFVTFSVLSDTDNPH